MTIRYSYLFWKFILLAFLTTQVFSQTTKKIHTLDTDSDTKDVITFTCGVSRKIMTLHIDGIDSSRILIKQSDGNFCQYSVQSCRDHNNDSPLDVVIEEETKNPSLYAGRTNKHYSIECKDGYDVEASVGPNHVSPSTTLAPTVVTKPNPVLSMKLTSTTPSTNGDFYVGEVLKLEMTSAGYIIFPQTCTAINGDHRSDQSVALWTYKTDSSDNTPCSTYDNAVTIEKWTVQNSTNSVSIPIYAFRFLTSSNIVIKCTAHLCSSSNDHCISLSKTCMNSVARRRRRSAGIVKRENTIRKTEEAYVSFRVVPQNKVQNNANALSVRFPAVFTAIIFGRLFLRLL